MKLMFLWIALALAACSSTPTQYHTLAADAANAAVSEDISQRIKSLGVGPIAPRLPCLTVKAW